MDWYEVILVSLLSAGVLFLLTKWMGDRQIAQLSMFDYITGITIGSIAAEMALGEVPTLDGVLSMSVYAALAVLISVATQKSIILRKVLVGKSHRIIENGKLNIKTLSKAKLDINDFLTLCRIQGYFDLSQIHTAVFEDNGHVSILPKTAYRPATPADFNLVSEQESIPYNVIMDGHIMPEILKQAGKNEAWLRKQLALQGYKSEKEIFLATCDSKSNLCIYPK